MKRVLLIFIFLFSFLNSDGQCYRGRRNYQPDKISVSFNAGFPFSKSSETVNGIITRFIPVSYIGVGTEYSLNSSLTGFSFGVEADRFSFEKQLEGTFSSSPSFGIVNTRFEAWHLYFPIGFQLWLDRRTGFRIGYVPGILLSEKSSTLFYGDAVSVENSFPKTPQLRDFQHSVSMAMNTTLFSGEELNATIEAYLRYSFNYLQNSVRNSFSPLIPGIAIKINYNTYGIHFNPGIVDSIRKKRQEKARKLAEKKAALEQKLNEKLNPKNQ